MSYFIYFIMAIVFIAAIAMVVRRSKPRGIAKEAKKLQGIFLVKEEYERYLAGLEELGQDDAHGRTLHGPVREEYRQRVAETIEEIAGAKSTLRRELEDKQRIHQAYQVERERPAARFKTGDLPLEKYEASERKLQKKTELIEPDIRTIERLISAESSGEVQSYRGTTARKISFPKTPRRKTK